MNPVWNPVFVLPNLSLTTSIETQYVALVPFDDSRVQAANGLYPAASRLLSSFVDHLKLPVEPAVLLMRSDAPPQVKTRDAVVAFRNAVALSATLHGWTFIRDFGSPQHTVWSGHFDFFPVTLHDENYLVTDSTALKGLWSAEDEFLAMPSPYLPLHLTPSFDKPLLRLLLEEWTARHGLARRESWRARKLFRSLQMAYQACQSPDKNLATIFEWGTSLALWIGAFEALFHPGGTDDISVRAVSAELGKYRWAQVRLREPRYQLVTAKQRAKNLERRRQGKQANNPTPDLGNLVQRLYYRLYDARNAFMHGNPVDTDVLRSFGKNGPSLINLAPILYRTGLIVYLNPIAMQPVKVGKPPRIAPGASLEWGFTNERYARTLLDPLNDHGRPR